MRSTSSVDRRLLSERFPRASAYHPAWVIASVSGGANSLWMTEWLAEAMDLRPGMRVLDLGCGRGASSVFLRRELGVQVWATDLWFNASENQRRFQDAGVADGVFPIHADARSLPFGAEFFDAIVSIDSFPYYGTDDLYLPYVARLLKPGGSIGIAGAGLTQEFPEGRTPDHLAAWWTPDMSCLHSPLWWRRHWEKSAIVDLTTADLLPNGWRYWVEWQNLVAPNNLLEIRAVEADQGAFLGYVRAVARRREAVSIPEPIVALSSDYVAQPLLREDPAQPAS